MSVDAVLGNRVGSIVAPAGCGKTHLIIDVLAVSQEKPYLVLSKRPLIDVLIKII